MSQDEICDKIDVENPSNLFYKGMMIFVSKGPQTTCYLGGSQW